MGRWKRKKAELAAKASAGRSADESTKSFSTKDRKLLRKYLEEYRDGALSLYYNENITSQDESDGPILIGRCDFPHLTETALRQPYLALPTGLSRKQRHVIHETCLDVDLFHWSLANDLGHRYVAVSVYSDGISQAPDVANRGSIDAKNFKPWACRNPRNGEDSPDDLTIQARDKIYAMVDQPGESLRDGIDTMDFEQIENDDLSGTTPPGFADSDWMLVDSAEKMRQCIQEIEDLQPTEIAFDLECYNQSKYIQMTCLLQIALTNGKEYVIDPLAPGVWDRIGDLAPIFADPAIVKIGHSIGGLDVRCLHRDFGIFVVNAFDTYEAAQCLQMREKGLAKVCCEYGLPNIEKYEALKSEYQTADWTKRPLTNPMIEYGRYDVHYLVKLRRLMMRDLAKNELWDREHQANKHAEAKAVASSLAAILRKFDEDEATTDDENDNEDRNADLEETASDDSLSQDANGERQSFYEAKELRMNLDLMQAISRSQERCLDLWSNKPEPPEKNSEYQSVVLRCGKHGVPFTPSQQALYRDLADWREEVAKKEEISAGFVCPLGLLAAIAQKRPTADDSLRRVEFVLPSLLEDVQLGYRSELFQMIMRSLKADGIVDMNEEDIPTYGSTPSTNRSRRRGKSSSYDHNKLGTIVVGVTVCVTAVTIAIVAISRRGR